MMTRSIKICKTSKTARAQKDQRIGNEDREPFSLPSTNLWYLQIEAFCIHMTPKRSRILRQPVRGAVMVLI